MKSLLLFTLMLPIRIICLPIIIVLKLVFWLCSGILCMTEWIFGLAAGLLALKVVMLVDTAGEVIREVVY